ncbi:MAG: ribosome assembly cofactor RimP [Bacteroidales bacterium]
MAEKSTIEKIVREFTATTGIFLVAVRISATGKITVLVDRKEGITIDDCADLSRFIESRLDRDVEDYELQVSSPGLDMPFLVVEQYYKNEGKEIEVLSDDGKKYKGILKNVTSGGFELETSVKEKNSSGSKATVIKDISFNYEQVKSAKEIVTFK